MSEENKLFLLLLFFGISLVASILAIVFIVIPKSALVQSMVTSEVMQFRIDVNNCYESNGSAYIADDKKVFCTPVKKIR